MQEKHALPTSAEEPRNIHQTPNPKSQIPNVACPNQINKICEGTNHQPPTDRKAILVLGNEFIQQDSLPKKIATSLPKKFKIINIKDSFQLITALSETKNPAPFDTKLSNREPIILDVIQNLQDVQLIKPEDLKNDSILSAHDFDAGYAIKLVGKDVRIIGIPMEGDEGLIREKVLELLM